MAAYECKATLRTESMITSWVSSIKEFARDLIDDLWRDVWQGDVKSILA